MTYEEIVQWCVQHHINLPQFFVLHLLVTHKTSTIQLYAKSFPEYGAKFLTQEDKVDLIDRGFLIPDGSKFAIGEEFLSIYCNEFSAGNALWCLYPGFVRKTDGNSYPLKTLGKRPFRAMYWDSIQGNRHEHEQVMLDTEYGIKHKLLTFGIKKFLDSEYWMELRKLRLDSTSNLNNLATTSNDDDY